MGQSASHAQRSSGSPWDSEAPPLDAVEGGEAEPAELAWYRTLLFMEDVWASTASVDEPDALDVPVRLRPLLETLAGYLRDGFSRLPLDDLQRAAIFLGPPLRSILERPNTRLARTHEHVRWERIDELDARSLLWMSRLPGRTMREKSASTRRALGVVRSHTLEVAENRVLTRLARDLLPWIERRIKAVEDLDARSVERARQEALLSLGRLLRDELPASPVGAVRPALRPEPNNALLGSGRYGKVWRAWRWLNLRQERFADLWASGPHLVQNALGLLIAVRLSARPDAFLTDEFSNLRLSGDGSGLGLVAPAPVDVLLSGASPRWVSIHASAKGQPLRIVTSDAMSGLVLSSLDIEVGFDFGQLQSGRGCAVRVTWIDFGRELLDQAEGWFDAEGVAALLEPVIEAIDTGGAPTTPRIHVAGARRDHEHPRHSQLIGADLAGLTPVLADETGAVTSGACCVAIDFRLDEERVQRVVGDDALAMQVARLSKTSFFLSASWDAIAAGDCPVADLASALGHLIGTDSHADRELCIPVPDGLGEPGEALLRAALPSHVRRTWLIPRAAAAALALRADAPEAIGVDEPLLVLDCGPMGFEGRLELLRAVPDARVRDPHRWECPLPWPESPQSKAGATRGFWRELTRDALGPEVAQEYIDRLVDSGLIARVASDPDGRPGACLFGGAGRLGPTVCVTQSTIEVAANRFAGQFRDWIDSLASAGAFSDAQAQAGRHRLHALVVGELLALPVVATALRAQCVAVLPNVVHHMPSTAATVARGGVEFLQRQRADWPTFEIHVPDLYLKSRDATGAAAFRPIFQNKRVRPGDVVPVDPMPFELPARVPRIELPLEREPGGRRPLAFRAVLEGEGLPLRAPLRVDLHVVYRYAEDGFRIRIRPRHIDETSVAFAECEVRWVRSDVLVDNRVLNNEPPGFPAAVEPSPAVAKSVIEMVQAFKTESETFLHEYAARRQGTGLRDFMRRLDEVAREVAVLSTGNPAGKLERPVVVALTDAWVAPLCLLANCSPDPYPKGRAPRWAPKASEIRKQLPPLCDAAVGALSRLRGSAPRGLPQALLTDAHRQAKLGRLLGEKQWMSLGRTINALMAPERGPAVRSIVEMLCDREALSTDEFGAWWALSTALWSDELLVFTLGADAVEILVTRVERVLQSDPPPRLDLFHEVGIVLLALLRRRGHPDAGPVDAGTPRLRQLADRIEEIERAFVGRGQPREPRLKLARQNECRTGVSAFVDSLAASLRGERVALIRMLED